MLNQAFVKALVGAMETDPANIDPRKWLTLSRDAVKEVVRHKIRLFGSAGTVTHTGFRTAASSHRSAHLGAIE